MGGSDMSQLDCSSSFAKRGRMAIDLYVKLSAGKVRRPSEDGKERRSQGRQRREGAEVGSVFSGDRLNLVPQLVGC